jgi:hypothetical protein
MDTLALGVIAIGVVAAIGVVLVAMGGSGSEDSAAAASPESARRQPEQPRPRPRPRRRQAVPKYTPAAPQHNGYTTANADPLVAGFMQVVGGELQSLRQQQEKIDQRLKLINGIAELMHDMQGASANGTDHASSGSNHRAASRG